MNQENEYELPERMILGIKRKGILLCDLETKKQLMFIDYTHIISWGVNNSVLVVVIQRIEGEMKKIYIDTFSVRF